MHVAAAQNAMEGSWAYPRHPQGVVSHHFHPEAPACREVGEEVRLDIELEVVSCGLAFQMLGVEVTDSQSSGAQANDMKR